MAFKKADGTVVTPGTGTDAFIPEIWSARLLEHLDKVHVYAGLMNRDYEGEISGMGDTVHINQIGAISVKAYDGSDIANPEELDSNTTTLVIDQGDYFNFMIKDVDNAQTNPKLMDGAMERAAYGINDTVDTYLAGILASGADGKIGNDTTPIVPTAATAYENLVDLGTKLTEANVPMMGRWVVIPPWFHGMLQKDARFVGNGTDANNAVLVNGLVGAAAGFQIYVSNNVPNTAGAKYKIIAGTNAAGAFAEQLTEMEAYRPEKNFADAVKGLHVYGAKVVQPKALAVLTANKS